MNERVFDLVDIDIMDKPHEECGIFGVYARGGM